MRECLNVIRKDARRFWPYIAVLLAIRAAALYLLPKEFLGSPLLGMALVFLPPLGGLLLMVMVIQEDAPCDDDQFWLTRPHRRYHLLAAKLLFAIVFLNLPYLVSDLYFFWREGLLPAALGTALWRQAILAGWFVLIPAAAASITRGLMQYLFCALAMIVAALLLDVLAGMRAVWGPLTWLRVQVEFFLFSGAAIAVLLWQYRRRTSAVSGGIFAMAFLVVLAISGFAPWTAAHAVQARSGQPEAATSVRAAFDTGRDLRGLTELEPDRRAFVSVAIPVTLTGVPRSRLSCDALNLCVEGDGAVPACTGWSAAHGLAGSPSGDWAQFALTREFHRRAASRRATLRVSLALTLFSERERVTLQPGAGEWRLSGGTVCRADSEGALDCRSLDQSTRILVERGGATRLPLLVPRSYGPLANDIHIVPSAVLRRSFPQRLIDSPALVLERPEAHFIRTFEVSAASLANFQIRDKR